MKSLTLVLAVIALLGVNAFGTVIGGFEYDVPDSMRLSQQAKSDGTFIVGFTSGPAGAEGYVNLYVRELGDRFNAEDVFFNGVSLLSTPVQRTIGNFDWWIADTRRVFKQPGLNETADVIHSTDFFVEEGGWLIFGNSRHSDRMVAQENAHRLLSTLRPKARSLTGPEYLGKKYYLGWGAAMTGDPSMMHNEVKFDVNHTHDIFTKDIGGNYLGTTLIGPAAVTRAAILNKWSTIKSAMTDKDMYVQYSSGHGSSSGLAVGVSYNEIRDHSLSLPAQEIIVFIMACNSGGLVDSFKAKQSIWGDWGSKGRTLMVFASSKKSENSSTGPGTDPDEPNGPNGSAGSAFGFALWKSLIGYADGFIDGVKDGYLSLGEIEKYTIQRTFDEGGHTPVSTGVYSTGLIMNKVPPKRWVEENDVKLSWQELSGLSGRNPGGIDFDARLRAIDTQWSVR